MRATPGVTARTVAAGTQSLAVVHGNDLHWGLARRAGFEGGIQLVCRNRQHTDTPLRACCQLSAPDTIRSGRHLSELEDARTGVDDAEPIRLRL